jgi:hypothetical protein
VATFTPGPSSSSKRVTVGPTVIPTRRVSTPCSAKACSSRVPVSLTAARSTDWLPDSSSNELGGNFHAEA